MRHVKTFEKVKIKDPFFKEDVWYIELLNGKFTIDDIILFSKKLIEIFKEEDIEYRSVFYDGSKFDDNNYVGVYFFFNKEIPEQIITDDFPIKQVGSSKKKKKIIKKIQKMLTDDNELEIFLTAKNYNL